MFLKKLPLDKINPFLTLAIQDVDSNEWYFCKAFGSEETGICFYVAKGLESYCNFLDINIMGSRGMVGPFGLRAMLSQEGMSVQFENREELMDDDFDLIKGAGYSFRGKHRWPVFRGYEKGSTGFALPRLLCDDLVRTYLSCCQDKRQLNKLLAKADSDQSELLFEKCVVGDSYEYRLLTLEPCLTPFKLRVNQKKLNLARMFKQGTMVLEISEIYSPIPRCDEEENPHHVHIVIFADKVGRHDCQPLVTESEKASHLRLCSTLVESF